MIGKSYDGTLANGVAATGAAPPAMLTETGVDIVTFGITKNGAMHGDVLVLLRPELATRARFVRKQCGQLPSKARFIAAQLVALLRDDLWIRQGEHANAMAQRLAKQVRNIDGVRLAHEPEANAVFVHLPPDRAAALQEWSFFWDWDLTRSLYRWMTSFATTEEDVDRFTAGVEALLRDGAPAGRGE
jgi:threonine aldolase